LGSAYDVCYEVPGQEEQDEQVVDEHQSHPAPQLGWCFRGVVVEYFEAAGVVVVVPVDLLGSQVFAFDFAVFLVLHSNYGLAIINRI